jgi:hypothetical protein
VELINGLNNFMLQHMHVNQVKVLPTLFFLSLHIMLLLHCMVGLIVVSPNHFTVLTYVIEYVFSS